MRPAVTGQLGGGWVRHHHMTRGTGTLGLQLHTASTGGGEHVALEAAALCPPAGGVVSEVLTLPAGAWGLLFKALVQCGPVVSLPVLPAVTASSALLGVQVEELAPLTGALGELSVAPLVRGPPVPVVKPLAVFLLLAVAGTLRPVPEDEPLSEAAGPASVGLVALPLAGQGVAWQTPALRLQRVHGPHEARGARVALLHGGARPRSVELVAGAILLIEYEALLALALRGLRGVVEGEVVAGRTGAPRVQLIALTNRSNGRNTTGQLVTTKNCVKEMHQLTD